MNVGREYLWEFDDFLAATAGRPIGEMPIGIGGVSIDTRTLEAGDAFFAIKGDRFDGHKFVTIAAGNNASLAVVAEDKLAALGASSLPMIVVADVLEAMGRLAVAARARSKARIIAVTGSVGKTTTKEMLCTLLEPCGRVHASIASYNNHWGVPLTLSRMRQDTEFGIFEIGMNHPGEITPLVKMVRPHVAMITTIGAAHMGFFESIEEIALAKAEIFCGVEDGGVVLINGDIKQTAMLVELASELGVDNVKLFGEKRASQFTLKDFQPTIDGSHIQMRLDGVDVELDFALHGRHMATNLIAAIGAAMLSGGEIDKIIGAVDRIKAVKGRGKTVAIGEGRRAITLIDESYNANPASMAASLNVLGLHLPTGEGRRVAVLGDMLELGKSSNKLHKGLAKPIREAKIDCVWLAGNEIMPLAKLLEKTGQEDVEMAGCFKSAREMQEELLVKIKPGDVIMFKASLGMKFGALVEAVSNHLTNK